MSARASVLVGERRVADADAVAGVEGLRAAQQLVVEVRAVRRAEVLDDEDRSLARQARVLRGGERILELDLDVAAAEYRALRDVVGHPAREAGHGADDEPRRDVGLAV